MFTLLQWWIFGASSAITFLCYHGIPNALHRTDVEATAKAAKSGAFEMFVRMCGNDHLVMFVGMFAISAGWSHPGGIASWVIVGSSVLVASISAASWFVIRRAGDG